MEYGTINADMNNNGKTFFVEMPSAVANDDKGKYTLTIDSAGDGLVFVRSGKVDVESSNRIAVVPAGNIVLTKMTRNALLPLERKAAVSALAISSMIPTEPKVLDGKEA